MSEKEIEDFVYDNPACVGVTRWIARQLRIKTGTLDLLGIGEDGRWSLVEVKNGRQYRIAVLQVLRYETDIIEIQRAIFGENIPGVRKVVIGESVVDMQAGRTALAFGIDLYSFGMNLNTRVITVRKYTTVHPGDEETEQRMEKAIEIVRAAL